MNGFLIFLLVVAVAWRLAAAFGSAGDTDLTVWGDRDLWRALDAGRAWPGLGPEINGGARPPGGAFYLLLAGILAIKPGLLAAHLGLLALFAASVALLGLFFAREVSPLAGAVVAAALAGSGALADALWVWNPGYLLFFAAVATLGGYRFLKSGGAWPLGLAAAAVSIGLQIHLQMFELAIALILAALLYRRRLRGIVGWRHGLALLAGLLLPVLPSLPAGGLHALGAAAVVPGGAVRNYVFGDFHLWDKIGLVYGLLGGDPWLLAPAAGMDRLGLAGAVANLAAALLAAGFVVGVPIGGIGGRRRRDGRPLGLFPLILAIYLLVALGSSVNFRHLVAAVPAVAVMIGLAAEALPRRLATARPGLAAAGALAVCLLLALRPVGLALAPSAGLGGVPTPRQAEIAATVKAAFYPDHEAFEAHAALFRRFGQRGWRLEEEGVSGQMAFIYRTTPPAPEAVAVAMAGTVAGAVAGTDTRCLAVLPKDGGLPADAAAQLAASPAFSGLSPRFAPMAAESPHFAYFPYTTADGNCLKTFSNAYIPTTFEAKHLPAGAPAAAGAADGAAVFVAPEPGQAFPLGIELRRLGEGKDGGEGYRAVLHGRLLRGYTGLSFQTILEPSLCLAGPGGVQVASFGRLVVGSPQRGSLAPWRSAALRLAEGSYDLWLTGRDGKRPIAVTLYLGRLSVPDLTASRSARPDPASPPKGCPQVLAGLPAGKG